MTKTQPWDRLPTEDNDVHWRAFQAYRNLGLDRTIPAAMNVIGVRPGQGRRWERWSSKFRWVERAAAWDAFLDGHAQRRIQADDTKAKADAVRRARAMQGLVVPAVNEWSRRGKANPQHLSKLKAGELAKVTRDTAAVADIGFRHEQILTGGATDRIDHTGGITIKKVDVGTVRPPIEEGK